MVKHPTRVFGHVGFFLVCSANAPRPNLLLESIMAWSSWRFPGGNWLGKSSRRRAAESEVVMALRTQLLERSEAKLAGRRRRPAASEAVMALRAQLAECKLSLRQV